MFCFKKFCLTDENTPMKIGMDSVLLGAWAESAEEGITVDFGSGCGILTFMMAQRFPNCSYIGVEIHQGAFLDSVDNHHNGSFSSRIQFYLHDFLSFDFQNEVNTIITNPPYFGESIHPEDYGRYLARTQTSSLMESMVKKVAEILCPFGVFSLIYDAKSLNNLTEICFKNGLFLQRSCFVKHFENHTPKRVLLQFGKKLDQMVTDSITIRNSVNSFSAEYKELTKDFYLKF
ncbi:MAG: methyltransferase [Bacteroidales bacterium]|nr:methyltransferase [Bacteroidales bacterium]